MITLVGGGGIPNYGDELIINNWLRWYLEDGDNSTKEIRVEGARSRVLKNMFSRRYPDVSWGHTIRNARVRFNDAGFWGSLQEGAMAHASSDPHVQAANKIVQASSIVHIHGGGYINGKWPTHAFVLGLAASAAKRSGARAVATGIGLRPLSDPEGAQRDILNDVVSHFFLIETRDEWSYDYLVRNLDASNRDKVWLGLDDAFLQPVPTERRSGRTLHLSLRADPAGESIIERLDSKFVGAFDDHRFWICAPRDATAYARLSEKFKFFEIAGTSQLVEDPHLAPGDVFITERFHPHLQAARAGASGIYWSGSEYYDTKHGSLVTLGSPFVEDTGQHFQTSDFGEPDSLMVKNDGEYLAKKRAIAQMIGTGSRNGGAGVS